MKILTSCPSCLQGLSRYQDDLQNGLLQADYIVVEMAREILGRELDARVRATCQQRWHRAGVGVTVQPLDCPLCQADGGRLVWQGARGGAQLRVVHAQETGFPAFYRVVWAAHVAEFSDLPQAERAWCMDAVVAVEQALRTLEPVPCKINIATLGNMVAHLHWHVIARYSEDSHFPAAVWASATRARNVAREAAVTAQLPQAEQRMAAALAGLSFQS